MRFKALSLLLLSLAACTSATADKRQTQSIDYASLSAALESLAQQIPTAASAAFVPTKTVNLNNIQDPPASVFPILITAVPLSVLGDLVNPLSRSSLASEFQAGNTPGWYHSLPTGVKSYLSVVHSQIQEGALTATTSIPLSTASSSGGVAAPAAPTGGVALAGSIAGALGIAGLAMVL
ncbi:hypothetical protein VTN77DRAFT_8734 [Rasamsonia byssochlamydoides]|uniref:uncharacterized protein n=1 Tax=Rasamsonia byssochlamydoides TaxID=89139 RepID=UPI003741EA3C